MENWFQKIGNSVSCLKIDILGMAKMNKSMFVFMSETFDYSFFVSIGQLDFLNLKRETA